MFSKQEAGLCWSAFFQLNESEKKQILSMAKEKKFKAIKKEDLRFLFCFSNCPGCKDITNDPYYPEAVQRAVLKFCLVHSDFARVILEPEELEQALNTFERKQYQSKILQYLLGAFCCAMEHRKIHNGNSVNDLYFLGLIIDMLPEIQSEQVNKLFLPLKKKIEKLAAGIKPVCYISGNDKTWKLDGIQLDPDSNQFVIDQFGYNFNQSSVENIYNSSFFAFNDKEKILLHILQMNLYPNEDFWNQHPDFSVLNMIYATRQYNGPRHAEKLLTAIFSSIQADSYGKKLLDNQLSLLYLEKDLFKSNLEKRTHSWAFERFENYLDPSKITEPMCYPFSEIDNAQEKCREGKLIFERFLSQYVYPDKAQEVLVWLNQSFGKKLSNCNWTLDEVLDQDTFGYHRIQPDHQAIAIDCKDYFSVQNLWNRVYLKTWMLSEACPAEKLYPNLFELYYNIFHTVEKETGILTAPKKDTKGKNLACSKLMEKLHQMGYSPSTKAQSDYTVSLLDRKVATLEEASRFSTLEQLGDAIYGLAVAEMMFYNPKTNETDIYKQFEKMTSAPFQIKVSKHFGFDRLYISASSISQKFELDSLDCDKEGCLLFDRAGRSCRQENYLADSLEMIIGTLCLDCGFPSALNFTKRLLKETDPEQFQDEVHPSDDNLYNPEIGTDYWTSILPALYSDFENDKIRTLWRAFDKAFVCTVIGTETPEKRKFCSLRISEKYLYGGDNCYFKVNPVFYDYLQNGFEHTVSKYRELILERYQNIK